MPKMDRLHEMQMHAEKRQQKLEEEMEAAKKKVNLKAEVRLRAWRHLRTRFLRQTPTSSHAFYGRRIDRHDRPRWQTCIPQGYMMQGAQS